MKGCIQLQISRSFSELPGLDLHSTSLSMDWIQTRQSFYRLSVLVPPLPTPAIPLLPFSNCYTMLLLEALFSLVVVYHPDTNLPLPSSLAGEESQSRYDSHLHYIQACTDGQLMGFSILTVIFICIGFAYHTMQATPAGQKAFVFLVCHNLSDHDKS